MKNAEHYIRIYCDYSDAEIRNREIALESPNILGTLVDHAGELPSGSGFFHDVLSPRIDRMRKIHPDYRYSVVLLQSLSKKQAWCCITWGYLVNRRPPSEKGEKQKILRTIKDISEYLEVSYDCYKKTRQRGIDRINAQLGVLIA